MMPQNSLLSPCHCFLESFSPLFIFNFLPTLSVSSLQEARTGLPLRRSKFNDFRSSFLGICRPYIYTHDFLINFLKFFLGGLRWTLSSPIQKGEVQSCAVKIVKTLQLRCNLWCMQWKSLAVKKSYLRRIVSVLLLLKVTQVNKLPNIFVTRPGKKGRSNLLTRETAIQFRSIWNSQYSVNDQPLPKSKNTTVNKI